MTKPTDETVVDRQYVFILKKFCSLFEKKIKIVEEKDGHKLAYVFLLDRGKNIKNKTGLVDIASNLKTQSIVDVLEAALETLKQQCKE